MSTNLLNFNPAFNPNIGMSAFNPGAAVPNAGFNPNAGLLNFNTGMLNPNLSGGPGGVALPNGMLDFSTGGPLASPNLTAPTTNTGFLSGMSGGDWLNFGGGLLSAGLGAYYQNKQLDQGQAAIDLARDKFNALRSDRAELQAANRSRQAASQEELRQAGLI